MSNPFLLPRPAFVSFSGGRTSGRRIWKILQAFGGTLPDDVIVVFNNTGKEREETLLFIEECSRRWGVRIRWLEYRWVSGKHSFVEVDFATASRKGEPFRQAIAARTFLPNPMARFCTVELKLRTSARFAKFLGWKTWTSAVGLRADEPKRVERMTAPRTEKHSEETLFGTVVTKIRRGGHSTSEHPCCPLAEAGIDNEDVLAFWASQPFDLTLPADPRSGKTLGGNCDLCFLKGKRNILNLIRQNPESADWWIESETLIKGKEDCGTGRFRNDREPYAELKRIALDMVPGDFGFAGLACGDDVECACTD